MQYASFLVDGLATWGAHVDGKLYDLGPSGSGVALTLRDAIASMDVPGPAPLDTTWASAPIRDSGSVEYLPVINNPGKVLCAGLNYRTHQEEASQVDNTYPVLFTRFADTQIGHLQPALLPAGSVAFDYEGEVAAVIGAPLHLASREEAAAAIAGYACYNDFSERQWQGHSPQWTPGKNFPGTGGFGPFFVPVSDVADPRNMDVRTRVNGELRQSATFADLIHDVPTLLSYISTFTPLRPGDVIVTGTPGGVGLFMEPPSFLAVGDVVEVEVTGLGILQNTVQAAPTAD